MSTSDGDNHDYCIRCARISITNGGLVNRIDTHTHRRSFNCLQCGEPFSCDYCGARFGRKTNLNHHIKNNHYCNEIMIVYKRFPEPCKNTEGVSRDSVYSCKIIIGVPQKSVLSPILFLNCINELSLQLILSLIMFADDIKISTSTPSPPPKKSYVYHQQPFINHMHATRFSEKLKDKKYLNEWHIFQLYLYVLYNK